MALNSMHSHIFRWTMIKFIEKRCKSEKYELELIEASTKKCSD